MKKIITAVIIVALGFNSNAQGNEKDFRFGLKIEPSFNWLKPDNAKDFTNGGLQLGFGVGAITDFKLAENIWLSTGFSLDFSGAKLNYLDNGNDRDTTGYYVYDDAIVEISDMEGVDSARYADYLFYQLNKRAYKVNYVNIPMMLKMKTNEIGYLTYYGQFGLLTSVMTKARSTDDVTLSGTASSLEDLNIDSEVSLMKASLSIGGGFEYAISESTSAFVTVAYNYGFTSITKKESKHVVDFDESDVLDAAGSLVDNPTFNGYTPQKNIPHAVRLTVGILF
jgi:hypothetical protein